MIRLLTRKEIDPVLWDEKILGSPNGNIYNLSWYLDHVSPGWMALVHGDYKGIMPLPSAKKIGIKIVYQPFFSRQCGIFRGDDNGKENAAFLAAIPEEFKRINLCLDKLDKKFLPAGFQMCERKYQKLSFGDSIAETRKKYSDNARRNIKKSQKNNLVFTFSDDVSSLIRMFRKQKGAEIRELKTGDYRKLESLMLAGLKNKYGRVAEVWSGDQLVASAYFWWFGSDVIYLKGTSTEKGRDTGAMYLLFDEIIDFSHADYSTLDFGGSDLASVASFFKRLGGEDQVYSCLRKDASPGWFRLAKSARDSLRKK